MGALSTAWKALSSRQRLVAEIAIGWVVTKILDGLSEWIFGPAWGPIAMVLEFLRYWVLNGYVGSAILGGLAIGFWPVIESFLRDIKFFSLRTALLFGLLALIIFGGFASATIHSLIVVKTEPRLFFPDANQTLNHDGSKRLFEDQEPWHLETAFSQNTQIIATQLTRSEIGKWIALTGDIYDVESATNGDLVVTLGGDYNFAQMIFAPSWYTKVAKLNKGQRIFGVCKIRAFHRNSIDVEQCEFSPKRPIIQCGWCGIRWHSGIELEKLP